MRLRSVIALLVVAIALATLAPSQSPRVDASASDRLTLANFEETSEAVRIIDPRLQYSVGTAPHSASATAVSVGSDGGNRWTVTSDSDSTDEYADYDLFFNLSQDWGSFTTLKLTYALTPGGGAPSTGFNIWMRDAITNTYLPVTSEIIGTYTDATHPLAEGNGPTTISLTLSGTAAQRAHINSLKFRVRESWFGGVGAANRNQQITLLNIDLTGSPNMQPNKVFWPLPAVTDATSWKWWAFTWTGGTNWLGGSQDPCAGVSNIKALMTAHKAQDGAFGGQPLIAIDFYKGNTCSYWRPGDNLVLRWYSYGVILAHTPIEDITVNGNAVGGLLAFRGDSRWQRDMATNVTVSGGTLTTPLSVQGRRNTTNGYGGGVKYSLFQNQVASDNVQFPNYAVVTTKLIDANVILAPDAAIRLPIVDSQAITAIQFGCGFLATSPTGFSDVQGGNCTPNFSKDRGNTWEMRIRKTTYQFFWKGDNKWHDVIYVGQSETANAILNGVNQPNGPGPCEDWWYAEGVGPIFVAKYPNVTRTVCEGLLAYNKISGTGGYEYHDPPQYLDQNLSIMQGYLRLDDNCVQGTCQVAGVTP